MSCGRREVINTGNVSFCKHFIGWIKSVTLSLDSKISKCTWEVIRTCDSLVQKSKINLSSILILSSHLKRRTVLRWVHMCFEIVIVLAWYTMRQQCLVELFTSLRNNFNPTFKLHFQIGNLQFNYTLVIIPDEDHQSVIYCNWHLFH